VVAKMATSLVPAGSDTGNELSEAFAALRDDEVLRRSVKTSQKYEKLWRGMLGANRFWRSSECWCWAGFAMMSKS
jgi:hypothetical protein